MDWLYQKGLICGSASETKSVALTAERLQRVEEMYKVLFAS